MNVDERVLDAIRASYDAALVEDGWRRAVGHICRLVDAPTGVIYSQDLVTGRSWHDGAYNFDDESIRLYEEHYGAINPWVKALEGQPPTSAVALSSRMVPEETYVRTEFHNEFFAPRGLYYSDGIVMGVEGLVMTVMALNRPRRPGPLTDGQVAVLAVVAPHVQSAFKLWCRIRALEGRASSMSTALDALTVGIVLLDDGARVLEMNRAAEEITSAGDGLSVDREGRLRAERMEDARELGRIVGGATGEGIRVDAGVGMSVQRPSGKRPYSVLATPAVCRAMIGDGVRPAAILVVTDPEVEPDPVASMVTGLLDLTPTETQVATGLMRGRSLAEVAGELGVSMNTVRTHVKRIFEKTRTSRQGQLVGMMFRAGLGAVRRD
jgi:DNA-binding CsgD family transcriptional regulator/PAS domain-containing protein